MVNFVKLLRIHPYCFLLIKCLLNFLLLILLFISVIFDQCFFFNLSIMYFVYLYFFIFLFLFFLIHLLVLFWYDLFKCLVNTSVYYIEKCEGWPVINFLKVRVEFTTPCLYVDCFKFLFWFEGFYLSCILFFYAMPCLWRYVNYKCSDILSA